MKNLIECICKQKPVVIWNPYEDNDTLTREEFLVFIKARGYGMIRYEGEWITAYQPEVTVFGYESIDNYIQEANMKGLNIYAALLEDEKYRTALPVLVRHATPEPQRKQYFG
jgi:hypothetical protein